jgi:hypothetical protein
VLQDLAARPEIQANYTVYLEEGPDKRGLDLGLLYRTDLVELVEAYSRQGCTNLADGLGPDGNDEPENPQNNLTCDWDADGRLDGNRLFSRPPLIAHLRVRPVEADGRSEDRQCPAVGEDFWVVVCHWKSKVEDSSTVEYTSPRRLLQAQFVAGLVREIHQSYPQTQLVVLGDFNDYPASQPMKLLTAEGLQSGMGLVGRASRYTYIYRGLSQVLDDILFMPQWRLIPARFGAAHIDADYPDAFSSQSDNCLRSSDHDPLFLDFATANLAAFLPLVRR